MATVINKHNWVKSLSAHIREMDKKEQERKSKLHAELMEILKTKNRKELDHARA